MLQQHVLQNGLAQRNLGHNALGLLEVRFDAVDVAAELEGEWLKYLFVKALVGYVSKKQLHT